MPERNERNRPDEKGVDKKQEDEEQSFYGDAFDEADKKDFDLAAGVDGIDDEIALLRGEIKKAIAGEDVSNLRDIVMATNALERLIRTKYQIGKDEQKGLKEGISNVMQDIASAAGVAAVVGAIRSRFG